jgi:hypothetical protein
MKFLSTLLFFIALFASSPLHAQAKMDTLQLDSVKLMTKLSDIYPLPGEKYQLHHFLAFISLPGIDPYAVYNHAYEFEPDLLEHISKLTPGSKFAIQPFAINSEWHRSKTNKVSRRISTLNMCYFLI